MGYISFDKKHHASPFDFPSGDDYTKSKGKGSSSGKKKNKNILAVFLCETEACYESRAWYGHFRRSGKLLFNKTKNVEYKNSVCFSCKIRQLIFSCRGPGHISSDPNHYSTFTSSFILNLNPCVVMICVRFHQ